MMMGEVKTSETSVYFKETTQHYIAEECHIHNYCLSKIISQKVASLLNIMYTVAYLDEKCHVGMLTTSVVITGNLLQIRQKFRKYILQTSANSLENLKHIVSTDAHELWEPSAHVLFAIR
jgi:hypothetical protein